MNRYPTNTDPARLERRTSVSEDAVNSITIGFTFDPTNVASQYANCIAELKTSVYPVMHGVVKYEDAYDKMLAAMKSAGLDEVVDEYKRQFDEWRAGRRKFRHTNTLRNHGTGHPLPGFITGEGLLFRASSWIVLIEYRGNSKGIQGDSKVINFTV